MTSVNADAHVCNGGAFARGWAIALLVAAIAFSPGCARAVAESPPASVKQPAPEGWFHVFAIDEQTYAISEPKYWQQNVSYLLLGTKQALLFDTGPGLYSIRYVVSSLTSLPLLVIPSHLHFDHVGDLQEFADVRLLDTPELRSQVHGGYFQDSPSRFMLRQGIQFKVAGWLADGQSIDLGGRAVRIFATAGHTPNSITILDALERKRLFTGDLVNRAVSLVDVPGSDINALAASLGRLVRVAPAGSRAYEAHSESPIEHSELEELAAGVPRIASRQIKSAPMCLGGVPMLRYDIGKFPFVLPSTSGATLPPLGTATQTLDWLGGACAH
jgi:hydroxyacylglutathione hydrolase